MISKIPLHKAGNPHVNGGERLKTQFLRGPADIRIGGRHIPGLDRQKLLHRRNLQFALQDADHPQQFFGPVVPQVDDLIGVQARRHQGRHHPLDNVVNIGKIPLHLAVIKDLDNLLAQSLQMLLVLALAPLLIGFVRKLKARLLRHKGPPIIQPWLDLIRLLRKEVVLADDASWLYRWAPYMIFAMIWVAASLVPTFATGLTFSWSADLIAIIALLGSARFFLALAGMDIGTSFGGIGSSREAMFGSLAEPAMMMIVFTVSFVAGTTQLSEIAAYMVANMELPPPSAWRSSRSSSSLSQKMDGLPIDDPATHLELTMVHEAMVLEYSGRYLALIELASALKLLLYISLIACVFFPVGLASHDAGAEAMMIGLCAYVLKLAIGGGALALFETSTAKMQIFRVPDFLGAGLMLGLLATLLVFVTRSL